MLGSTDKHYPHAKRGRWDAFPATAAAQDGGQAAQRAGPGWTTLWQEKNCWKEEEEKEGVYGPYRPLMQKKRVGSPEEEIKKKRI